MRSLTKMTLTILAVIFLCAAHFIYAFEPYSTAQTSSQSDLEGVWEGALNVQGVKLRLVLHIVTKDDGSMKAVMDSPDQSVKDILVDDIWVEENTLNFVVMSIQGGYKGEITEESSNIKGTWKQGGQSFPLNLKLNPDKEPRELKERTEAAIDRSIYKQYIGKYQIQPQFILTVTTRNERLFVQATAQPQLEIFPESETKFFYKSVNAQITFVKDDSGKVSKLILHQNGRDMHGPKLDE